MNINMTKASIVAALLILSFWMSGAIIALLIIGLLITLHEFGHWLVARRAGIDVPIFSVGFGRADQARVLGKFCGTEFQVRPFPLGGFVAPEPSSYQRASIGARAAVLAAGPLMNLFIAALLFFCLFVGRGVPRIEGIKDVYVGGLSETISIAAQNGIAAGDIILSVNGAPIEKPEQVSQALAENRLKAVSLTLERDGTRKIVDVVPNEDGKIGIQMAYHLQRSLKQVTWVEAAFYALAETTGMIKSTLASYGDLIAGKNLDQLSSIVGIVAEGGKQVDAGMIEAVYFTSMLSIALAILNALPLPGLDGGQLFLLAIERYRGKPLSAAAQGKMVAAVVVALVGLTFYALYNDFVWLLGEFWAVPAYVLTLCLVFYALLPFLNKFRQRFAQPRDKS